MVPDVGTRLDTNAVALTSSFLTSLNPAVHDVWLCQWSSKAPRWSRVTTAEATRAELSKHEADPRVSADGAAGAVRAVVERIKGMEQLTATGEALRRAVDVSTGRRAYSVEQDTSRTPRAINVYMVSQAVHGPTPHPPRDHSHAHAT